MPPRKPRRSVLSVASECVPLIKTGGLADVVGALPRALKEFGWQTRVLMPAYPGVADQFRSVTEVWSDPDLFGGPATVLSGTVGGLRVLALSALHLYDRAGGIYQGQEGDHPDNDVRFAALSWVAARLCAEGTRDGWKPTLLHAHDWQAGLTPAYLRFAGTSTPSVMTIHNMAFQGIASADRLEALRLPREEFHHSSLEYYGQISALKAGLVHADRITTVSPSYAEELMRPEFGFGLEGVVIERSQQLSGIVNGIDTSVWNPAEDVAIPQHYDSAQLGNKQANREALLEEFGLGPTPGPLAIVVSRLSHQKGIDLLLEAIPEFIQLGGSVVLLGAGDADLEHGLRTFADQYPDRVGVRIGYDEALSHRMFAGGDAVIVPSRFEPCGLTQLYGLRYGTIPVVASTGGLRDTVIDASVAGLAGQAATGIGFSPFDALALGRALARLVALYADPPTWRQIQRRAMMANVGWKLSAKHYAELFDELVASR